VDAEIPLSGRFQTRCMSRARDTHFQPIEIGGQQDLARQAAGAADAGGQIEHVFLVVHAAGNRSNQSGATITWQVEQAICPSQVPSSGIRRSAHFQQALSFRAVDHDALVFGRYEGDLTMAMQLPATQPRR
jgi:hypothetical protein